MINALFQIVLIFFVMGILAILMKAWSDSRDEKKYRKQKRETEIESKKEYIQAKINQSDDPQTILKVVEGRKQRARDLGIEKGIDYLFFGGIGGDFGFGAFYKCSIISNFKVDSSFSPESGKTERYYFTLKGRNYMAQMISSGPFFELFMDDKKVLAIKMMRDERIVDCSPYLSSHERCVSFKCLDIESFMEGDWISDLRDLIERIEIDKKEERRKQDEDPDRIKKLKEKFDI